MGPGAGNDLRYPTARILHQNQARQPELVNGSAVDRFHLICGEN
jgi:hypothetical protein